MSSTPAYISLFRSGELALRAQEAERHLVSCDLCPWECHVDRTIDDSSTCSKLGICRTGCLACISSYGPHYGEERPISGQRGSGTIFFTNCNLKCQYCQNYDISQVNNGLKIEPDELASIMLELQELGSHNINFVSPSHVVAQILASLLIAVSQGLHIPLVYNSGGYDSLTALKLLDGVIDIYMPDMKYADDKTGIKYSKIANYPAINQAAIIEMHRQVCDLQIDINGVAQKGLLVRHLVLPNNLAGTERIVHFLANQISKNTYLNIMDQYRPAFKANEFPEINRPTNQKEYQQALEFAFLEGLVRLDR